MINHLFYPTPAVKSFRPDFVCMADCGAVNLAGLDSKSEWTVKTNCVLVPPFLQYLESLLVQNMDLNLPLKSTLMRKNTPLPNKPCPTFKSL